MKLKYFSLISIAAIALMACGNTQSQKKVSSKGHTNDELKLTGDKTIYGLACEGCTDSVVLLLPNDGSDPIEYDIIDAFRNHKIIGKLQVGDWIGIVPNKADKTVADIVINLDELKGTWCYQVMPKMRDRAGMSKRMQQRMMANMPDSIKETLLIPREYGFTLKRQWKAQAIGHIRRQNALEEESPVVYPKVRGYYGWHIWNGKLVLTHGDIHIDKKTNDFTYLNSENDTADFNFMRKDSLSLQFKSYTLNLYRKSNAEEANAKAKKIAEEQSKKSLEKVK